MSELLKVLAAAALELKTSVASVVATYIGKVTDVNNKPYLARKPALDPSRRNIWSRAHKVTENSMSAPSVYTEQQPWPPG
jgi:hypothetical protein